MPKKNKTRKQKIMADHHREKANTSLYSIAPNSLISQSKNHPEPIKKTIAINTSSYNYLTIDLTKTILLTIGIIIIELILHFFTK